MQRPFGKRRATGSRPRRCAAGSGPAGRFGDRHVFAPGSGGGTAVRHAATACGSGRAGGPGGPAQSRDRPASRPRDATGRGHRIGWPARRAHPAGCGGGDPRLLRGDRQRQPCARLRAVVGRWQGEQADAAAVRRRIRRHRPRRRHDRRTRQPRCRRRTALHPGAGGADRDPHRRQRASLRRHLHAAPHRRRRRHRRAARMAHRVGGPA